MRENHCKGLLCELTYSAHIFMGQRTWRLKCNPELSASYRALPRQDFTFHTSYRSGRIQTFKVTFLFWAFIFWKMAISSSRISYQKGRSSWSLVLSRYFLWQNRSLGSERMSYNMSWRGCWRTCVIESDTQYQEMAGATASACLWHLPKSDTSSVMHGHVTVTHQRSPQHEQRRESAHRYGAVDSSLWDVNQFVDSPPISGDCVTVCLTLFHYQAE